MLEMLDIGDISPKKITYGFSEIKDILAILVNIKCQEKVDMHVLEVLNKNFINVIHAYIM